MKNNKGFVYLLLTVIAFMGYYIYKLSYYVANKNAIDAHIKDATTDYVINSTKQEFKTGWL